MGFVAPVARRCAHPSHPRWLLRTRVRGVLLPTPFPSAARCPILVRARDVSAARAGALRLAVPCGRRGGCSPCGCCTSPARASASWVPWRWSRCVMPGDQSVVNRRNGKRIRDLQRSRRVSGGQSNGSGLVWSPPFSSELVKILKAAYAGRSYYGGPDYRCLFCCFGTRKGLEVNLALVGRCTTPAAREGKSV